MAVTGTHFRFGSDDGTEVTHTFKALIDTNPTHNWAWATFLLRLTEQCDATAASNEAATFQYQKNGGTWTAITTSSANVKAVTPSAWANGAACTKRLTGTGTFESSGAGCTTDGTSGGTANDIVASGNSETEIALQFVEANLANGDTMAFRITGSPTAISMTVSPSITVVKIVNYPLTADGITTTPALDTPAVSQNHALPAPAELAATPALVTPALSQNHVLAAPAALSVGAPALESPVLTVDVPNTPLTANDITASPALGTPAVSQNHAMGSAAIATTPALGVPAVTQIHALGASGTTASPALGTPAVHQEHALMAAGISTTPALSSPAITQLHIFSASGITAQPVLGTPVLTGPGQIALTADGILISPVLGAPALAQLHALAAAGFDVSPLLGTPALTEYASGGLQANPLTVGTPSLGAPLLYLEDFTLGPQLYPWGSARPAAVVEIPVASPSDISLRFRSTHAVALVSSPADLRLRFHSRLDLTLPGGTV